MMRGGGTLPSRAPEQLGTLWSGITPLLNGRHIEATSAAKITFSRYARALIEPLATVAILVAADSAHEVKADIREPIVVERADVTTAATLCFGERFPRIVARQV